MEWILAAVSWFAIKIIEAIPGKTLDGFLGLLGKRRKTPSPLLVDLYPPDCGDHPIDLGYRKPYVAEAFGGYFAGLLEDAQSYLRIDEQIDCPIIPETEKFAPVARVLYELRRPMGARLVIVAASGGMGKTTLATKIVRCLFEQKDADFILGDSAKSEHLDLTTGEIYKFDPAFSNSRSFYKRLYHQVGLPAPVPNTPTPRMVERLIEQLHDYRVVIILDNLDTLADTRALLSTLEPLLGRNVRAIVTTREIAHINPTPNTLVVNIKPLLTIDSARAFLNWHIQHYQPQHPKLAQVSQGLADGHRIENLIKKTGGIPLIMQLALNDAETKSWEYIENLPEFKLSTECLDFLYKARWDDLTRLGAVGLAAQNLIRFIAVQQTKGKRVAFGDLDKWASKNLAPDGLKQALVESENRFLLLNRDLVKGNFAVFPSLVDFVQGKVMQK